jgi:hypothetical protein
MRLSQTQMLLALLVIGVGGVYFYKQQQAKKLAAAIKTAAPAGGLYAAPPTFEQTLPSYSIPSMPGDTMVSGYNQLG